MNRRRFLQLSAAAAAGGFVARPARAQNEIWRMSASDIVRAVRTKKVSAREVVQAHLDRIEAVNGKVHAVTRVLAEEALAVSDEADRTLARGGEMGPLHGVPMTVKENIDRDREAVVGLSFLDYSVLLESTPLGPRSFPVTGLADLPIVERDLVLTLITSEPVRFWLDVSAVHHLPDSPFAVAHVQRPPEEVSRLLSLPASA